MKKNVENSTINVKQNEQKPNKILKSEETKQSSNYQQTKKNTKVIKENLEKIKQIRIDNTLAHFNKQEVRNITPTLELLNDLLLDPEYSHPRFHNFRWHLKSR